jgi:hypothetical protein
MVSIRESSTVLVQGSRPATRQATSGTKSQYRKESFRNDAKPSTRSTGSSSRKGHTRVKKTHKKRNRAAQGVTLGEKYPQLFTILKTLVRNKHA